MTTDHADLRRETAVALEAIYEVLPIVLERRGADEVRAKGPHALVTATDLQVEQTLERFLTERLPGTQFVGEEGGQSLPENGRLWLVDPLCGTENYAAGLPLYAVNIALAENGRVTAAVVADGSTGEVYVAQRGAGAFVLRGGRRVPLHVDPSSQLLSLDPSVSPRPNFGVDLAIRALASGEWNVRMLSTSLALPYLADGRLAVAVYSSVGAPVHYAAGLLVAEEAGARVTDAAGAEWDLHSPVYAVAASDELHRAILDLIART